jgi:predicted dehydrogenase
MEQARIGFIGAGGIAGRHIGNLRGFHDAKIVALADPLLERALSLSRQCSGATAYDDYREMLDSETLDGVYICTPPFAHGDIEQAVISRGHHFFVEKPLATDLPTAEGIASAAHEKNLITAVGYHWRYLDTVNEARDRLSGNPARLALGYWIDGTPPPRWWIRNDESGGQMIEQTTHIFDLARYLVGDVRAVFGAGAHVERPAFPEEDIFNVTTATLYFESGALGNISSTCLLNWPHRIGLHLFSEGMVIELTEHEIMIDVGHGRPVRHRGADPFVLEDRDFVDAVLGRENHIRTSYHEALETHRLTVSATQSAAENRLINLTGTPNHV